ARLACCGPRVDERTWRRPSDRYRRRHARTVDQGGGARRARELHGRLSRDATTLDLNTVYNAAATVRVVFAGNRAHFMAMNRAIAVNQLHPIIDRVFEFHDTVSAFRYYETGRAFGKIVLTQSRRSA